MEAQDEAVLLRWSPSWAVELDGGTGVVLSAGADRRVAIDGLTPTERELVERWQADGWSPPPDGDGDGRAQALTDRLVELGALLPSVSGTDTAAAPVHLVGEPALLALFDPFWPRDGQNGSKNALIVAVRTATDWPDVPANQLHLGLDLTMHHTIVLGPLVVPGASACLQCLDRRMGYRWPAPVVPPEPAVRRSLAVAAALLEVQVGLALAHASPLVNATIAWDLERGTTDRQRVYKVAGCPRCDRAAPVGRVQLGWEGA